VALLHFVSGKGKPLAVLEIKFFYPNGRWWHIPGNLRACRA
jgi:hypothetical protein